MTEDTLIVGAGPIGLACAISARRHGIDPLVIDAGPICNSIVHYPIGMTFFTTPELLEIGGHPLVCAGAKPTREETLKYFRGIVRTEGIRVRTFARLLDAEPAAGGITSRIVSRHGPDTIRSRRVVLATGYFDHHNTLDVPGANLDHVSHYFDEAHRSYGLDVVVIGGRNSAVEAALELYRGGARTTIVYRGREFRSSVKYWMKPDIENRIAAGEITAHLGATVRRIEREHVVVQTADGGSLTVKADRVYALIGFHPDFELFRRIGIVLEDETCIPALDRATLQTNVPGVYMAGSITEGRAISSVFIENGRFDGEKIFGTRR